MAKKETKSTKKTVSNSKRKRTTAGKSKPKAKDKALVKVDTKTEIVGVRIMNDEEIIRAFDVMGITSRLKSEEQKRLFIAIAKEFTLNPLRREIHAVPMDGGLVPVVGYEVYIDRAERSGRLQYWNIVDEGEVDQNEYRKSTLNVTIIIKRKDWPHEWKWKVLYREVCGLKDGKPNFMWKNRPVFMTQKVAISQGFRLCFRDVIQGMPYIDAEIQDQESEQAEPKKDLDGIYQTSESVIKPKQSESADDLFEKCIQAINTLGNNSIKPAYAQMAGRVKGDLEKLKKLLQYMTGEDKNKLGTVQLAESELFGNNNQEERSNG